MVLNGKDKTINISTESLVIVSQFQQRKMVLRYKMMNHKTKINTSEIKIKDFHIGTCTINRNKDNARVMNASGIFS